MTLAWIDLNSGRRSLKLISLEVFSTYGGLLVGYPCALINDRLLARLTERDGPAGPQPVHVITPPRTYPGGPESPLLGPQERLPSVYCRGRFESSPVDEKLDDGLHASFLTMVWFQDDLAHPIADFVRTAVADLPWEELAQDCEL